MTKDKNDQQDTDKLNSDTPEQTPELTPEPTPAAAENKPSASETDTTPAAESAQKRPAKEKAAKDAQVKESSAKPSPAESASAKPKTAEPKTARKGPHPLAWINLILMLGLLALGAFAGWLVWQQQQSTSAELAVLKDRLLQAQQQAGNLAAAEGDLLSETQSLKNLTTTLKQQVEHNTDRLGKLPGAERQDWLLAEAEYLLRMANQRLLLEKDVEGSLSMLQAADNVLVETRNPQLNPVRKTITEEIQSLRASPAVDVTGAVLRLQTLQEALPQLPWLPDRLLPDGDKAETVAEEPQPLDQPWYLTLWHTVKESLSTLVRFRERSEPIAAPLSPDQQYYLQQNMHLMLEQAQVALLRKQDDLYKHSLSRVAGWLDEYLLIDDQRTVAAKLALQELQGWQVNPPLPDITGSLMQLQKLVENQRRGSVLPRQPAPANEAADGGNQ
ncbi:MAG: hypothetical protein CMI13_14540 [Oleibacter sp.]|nr:hypothetical protein [Thalassolituus sp.]